MKSEQDYQTNNKAVVNYSTEYNEESKWKINSSLVYDKADSEFTNASVILKKLKQSNQVSRISITSDKSSFINQSSSSLVLVDELNRKYSFPRNSFKLNSRNKDTTEDTSSYINHTNINTSTTKNNNTKIIRNSKNFSDFYEDDKHNKGICCKKCMIF
jgi:hypothetical protein